MDNIAVNRDVLHFLLSYLLDDIACGAGGKTDLLDQFVRDLESGGSVSPANVDKLIDWTIRLKGDFDLARNIAHALREGGKLTMEESMQIGALRAEKQRLIAQRSIRDRLSGK